MNRYKSYSTLLFILAVVTAIVISNRAEINPWSDIKWSLLGSGWDTAQPLEGLTLDFSEKTTKALLVIKDDSIIYEKYAPTSNPNRLHNVASLSKALVGSMSLLLALNDGLMRMDDPAWRYIKKWEHAPRKSKITIQHLASHSSGIPHKGKDPYKTEKWQQAFWERKPEPFSLVLSEAPVECIPGECYQYSGPAFAALAYALTTRLKSTGQPDIQTLLDEKLIQPLGIPDSDWLISYGESYQVDDMTLYATWGGALFTARAAARIGQFMLHLGKWHDNIVVDSTFVKQIIAYDNTPVPEDSNSGPLPTAGWWSNANGALPSLPKDAYLGAGAGHQILLVIPSMNVVVVRYGNKFGNDAWAGDYWSSLETKLLKPLMQSLASYK